MARDESPNQTLNTGRCKGGLGLPNQVTQGLKNAVLAAEETRSLHCHHSRSF